SGVNDPCTWNLEGNVNLKPETSDTTTLGVVLTPADWVAGLQFSADWFHIKINDAIEQANPTLTQAQCRAGETSVCNLMTFNPFSYNGLGQQCGTLAGFPVPALIRVLRRGSMAPTTRRPSSRPRSTARSTRSVESIFR